MTVVPGSLEASGVGQNGLNASRYPLNNKLIKIIIIK